MSEKSKVTSGVLGILLGGIGIHKFYLGYTGAGLTMLLVSLVGSLLIFPPLIMGLIGLIEGIIYLTKSDEDFQRDYVQSAKNWF